MQQVFKASHLKKYYISGASGEKFWAVNDVSFAVNEGECLGIVGESGCGKSTTAKIAARLIDSDAGQLILRGKDITHATGKELFDVYRHVQMIFQMPEDSFDPRHTLGWSIAESLKNFGAAQKNIEEYTDFLLEEVGLTPKYAVRYPHEVSGGECQRAAIARAIAVSPQLLICDEATGALDVTVQARVVKLLARLCNEKKIACLFITHDPAILAQIADRAIVMREGRIIDEGTPQELFYNAKSPFTRALMSANLFID